MFVINSRQCPASRVLESISSWILDSDVFRQLKSRLPESNKFEVGVHGAKQKERWEDYLSYSFSGHRPNALASFFPTVYLGSRFSTSVEKKLSDLLVLFMFEGQNFYSKATIH